MSRWRHEGGRERQPSRREGDIEGEEGEEEERDELERGGGDGERGR